MSSPSRRLAAYAACLLLTGGCDALAPRELNFRRASAVDGRVPNSNDGGPEDSLEGGASDSQYTMIVVEAESFDVREENGNRDYYRIGSGEDGDLPGADPDPSHASSAGGGGYVEVLPDRRVKIDDNGVGGLFNEPGRGPLLHYYIAFPVAGSYYLWMRGYSTGSEDETAFFTIDSDWSKAQLVSLCLEVDDWQWTSHERENGPSCGMIGEVRFEVTSPGLHTVSVSAREDGFELDKWLVTTDANFVPRGLGPAPTAR